LKDDFSTTKQDVDQGKTEFQSLK